MTQFHDSKRGLRPALAASAAGLAIVAVAATALAVGGRAPSSTGGPPVAVADATVAPARTEPPAAPVATPVPTPVATARPTPVPTAAPTRADGGGGDAIPMTVDLETFDRHAVHVDVADQTGTIRTAVSGTPGDGASVGDHELVVENVDARTLRLTWIDYPIDNADSLFVEWFDGHIRLLLVQPEPTGTTDAIGFDRVLVLTFSEPVSAAHVKAFLQDGLDTSG
jgi:hypothetical protein